ncbi:IucA/IucC family protein [Halostagnicola bangensis]
MAAPIEAIHGYDRFRLAEAVTLLSSTEAIQNPHPVTIISLLEQEGVTSQEQAERITEEIAESTANLAFARLADPTNPGTTFEASADHSTVLDILETLPGADPASALERLATEGHPFHPSAKIRRGMNPAESLLYAPEFTDEIDVRFVAVETEHALQAHTGPTLTELLYDCFPRLKAAVERGVPTNRSSEDYVVVPVHPWQYYHVIPDRYAAQIDVDRVVPVPEYTVPATPLLNLRTVVPKTDNPQTHPQPHLKLAVDVQLTNVVRTVSPQAVSNGPQVTELLHTILECDSFDHLGILSEAAATCYHAPGGPHPDGDEYHNARNLSGLARQNPYAHSLVPEEGVPIAVGSLLTPSPVTNQPIVCDVLDQFAATRNKPVTTATAKAFFEAYVDTVVPEQLHLLSKYGIALETHPQNSYVVFSNGEPVATVVRDLGGIRVLNDRLTRHGFTFDAYPDSDVDADGERDLYNKLYYALFQNHFTELIITLVEHTPLDETACWDYVRTRCLETFEMLRTESNIPEKRVNRDENALFKDPATHKALTAMRLQGKRHEYVTSHVSNPLVNPAE